MNYPLFRHSVRNVLLERVINGYVYHCHSIYKEHTLYVKCRDYPVCPSRGKIKDGELSLSREHNHNRMELLETILEFENALYNSVMINPFKSLRVIYDETSLIYLNVSIHRTWNSMMKVMQNWRTQYQPQTPNSFQEYINLLEDPRWQHFTHIRQLEMRVTLIQAADGSSMVAYANVQLLEILRSTEFYVDSTFKIVPHKPKALQLMTVLARVSDSEVIPVFWVLMERKTTQAYSAAFQYFSQLTRHIVPSVIMSDFEIAMSRSIQLIYPNTSRKHCYFHYSQAIIKRLKKLGLLNCLVNSPVGQIFIRKVLALPLLPRGDIIPGFNWIVENLPDIMRNLTNKFINYFRRQWLRSVTPDGFSVYGSTYRTNNFSESYNRVLKKRLGTHANIWCFTDNLLKLQAVSVSEHQSIELGYRIKRDIRFQSVIHNQTIQDAWNLYQNQLLSIPLFLSCASSFLKSFRSHIIRNETEFLEIFRVENDDGIVEAEYRIVQDFSHLAIFSEADLYQLLFVV